MALALLAIWLLSLLAPMHQISRSIGDLSKAGIVSVTDWSLCVPVDPDGDGPESAVSICPAQGIGKFDLPAPAPAALPGTAFPVFSVVAWDLAPERFWPRIQSEPGQPRAPPAQI